MIVRNNSGFDFRPLFNALREGDRPLVESGLRCVAEGIAGAAQPDFMRAAILKSFDVAAQTMGRRIVKDLAKSVVEAVPDNDHLLGPLMAKCERLACERSTEEFSPQIDFRPVPDDDPMDAPLFVSSFVLRRS